MKQSRPGCGPWAPRSNGFPEMVWRPALAFLMGACSLLPAQGVSPGYALVESRLASLPPRAALVLIDSAEAAGGLRAHVAQGLRARAMNKPGEWELWGNKAGVQFAEAIDAYETHGLETEEDSVSYHSLLLNCVYYHGRAAQAGDRKDAAQHASQEMACIRTVLDSAPLLWQRAGASVELGRFYAHLSLGQPPGTPDSSSIARRLLRMAADEYPGTDAAGPALWHLAWLEAELGNYDEARGILADMEANLTSTKWAPRARALRRLITRSELFLDSVVMEEGMMRLSGCARNLQSRVHVRIEQVRTQDWFSKGRLPLPGELHRGRLIDHTELDVGTGPAGGMWSAAIDCPGPGLYRLVVDFQDSTLLHTLGLWNWIPPLRVEGKKACVGSVPSGGTVMLGVGDEAGGWSCLGERSMEAHTEVCWEIGEERPLQALGVGSGWCGWIGPSQWAPSFELLVEKKQ